MSDKTEHTFGTPILFVVFNRPEQTREVFEAIRSQRPEKLYIAADGPRNHVEGDAERCRVVREIVSNIDWCCRLKTRFQEENLGCRRAVSEAIDWFFEDEEEGVVLEDDCLPSSYFFEFVAMGLERYRENEQIMHIGGINYKTLDKNIQTSYYFSNIPHIWGWATWRRAWKRYDRGLAGLSSFVESGKWRELDKDIDTCYFWIRCFYGAWSGKVDTWDYQWWFSVHANNGLSIAPTINLVKNIGFSHDSTHTKTGFTLGLPTQKEIDMQKSLPSPIHTAVDSIQDDFLFRKIWNVKEQNVFFLWRLKKLLRRRHKVKKMIKEIVDDTSV